MGQAHTVTCGKRSLIHARLRRDVVQAKDSEDREFEESNYNYAHSSTEGKSLPFSTNLRLSKVLLKPRRTGAWKPASNMPNKIQKVRHRKRFRLGGEGSALSNHQRLIGKTVVESSTRAALGQGCHPKARCSSFT